MDARPPIRFLLDGHRIEVGDLPATTTLLQYLREHAGRCGTKEGCAEGDCGACTVLLGELDTEGRPRYRAINSCIRLLPTVDGRELVTVESLSPDVRRLHPVQQALVDCHGSQCGFCTPGFVMSLLGVYLEDRPATRASVVQALSGNLCRCTGYRPIIDAGCRMHEYPRPPLWSPEDAASPERAQALRALQRDEPLRLPGFVAPRDLDTLAAAVEADPEALLLAGGTDIGLWVTKQFHEPRSLIYLGEVAELRRIERDGAALSIGAAVALADAWAAIVAQHPELAELAERFASPPVRHSGTLGGNLANGSPIGDSMPALIAISAEISLRKGSATRRLPLEAFYLDYRKKDLAPGEFLCGIHLPARAPGLRLASYKLSKRYDQDISAVCAAFALRIAQGRVAGVRLAYGGMAGVPKRAYGAESALLGQPFDEAALERAVAALALDFQPLSDMRASAAYRLRMAGALLRRFFLAQSGGTAPLRSGAALAP